MKIVLLSDCHIMAHNPVARLDDAHETSIRKFNYVLNRASDLDAIMFQAGDMFDRPRSWYLLPEMVDLLRHYKEKGGVEVYSIFGHHDQYFYSHETRHTTNLGVLAEMGLVTILDEHPLMLRGGDSKVIVYGVGEGEKVPKIEGERKENINILVIHDDISDRPLWPGHDHIQAERFLLRHKDFDLILCGDIHRHFLLQLGDRAIVNTGPMIRKTVDLWDHEPCFYVYDTETRFLARKGIPYDLPEVVLTRSYLDDKKENRDMLDDFVEAMKGGKVQGTSFKKNLKKFIEQNDIEQDIVDIISKTMEKKDE